MILPDTEVRLTGVQSTRPSFFPPLLKMGVMFFGLVGISLDCHSFSNWMDSWPFICQVPQLHLTMSHGLFHLQFP